MTTKRALKNKVNKMSEKKDRSLSRIFDDLLHEERSIRNARPLTEIEKAKFEQEIAIEQLYYSSKLEGSHLTSDAIAQAIHGKEV